MARGRKKHKATIWLMLVFHLILVMTLYTIWYSFVLQPREVAQMNQLYASSLTTDPDEYETPDDKSISSQPIASLEKEASSQVLEKQDKAIIDQSLPDSSAVVKNVVDGDTITVVSDGVTYKVRLLGIDTPETKDPRKPVQCYGFEASRKMKELVEGKSVVLVVDESQGDKDKYGRLLRYVYLADGTLVNAVMVEEGYAFAYRKYPTAKLNDFISLEQQAKDATRGLWAANTCNGKVDR